MQLQLNSMARIYTAFLQRERNAERFLRSILEKDMINRCLREFLIARRRLQVVCTLKIIKKYFQFAEF